MELTKSQARIKRQKMLMLSIVSQGLAEGMKKTKAVKHAADIVGVTERWVFKTLKRNENGHD